ncbi:hydroxyproline dehydrogenase-like [Littorina saxatilis]|uniref:hydroxyproline dehydrogenase-like n=1 Tax=Littorina saxatilis TaxID=31220 RepID=UPI0038B4CD74
MHRIHAPRGVLGYGQFAHRCLFEVTPIRGKSTPTKSTQKQTATGGTSTFLSDRLAWTDAFKTANEWSPYDRLTNPHRMIHNAANQNQPPVHHSAAQDFLQQNSTNQNVVYQQSGYGSVAATETFMEEPHPVVERKRANFDVSFDDFKTAFSKKSNWELIRALSVLRVCSFEVVADHSLKLMSTSQRVLRKTASDWLMKKTVYGQFVAGETTAEIKEAVSRLQEVNVGPLLAAPMEDDIHTHHPEADKKFDANLNTILNGMRLARELDPLYPMTQLKMTALMPGDLCALLSLRCPRPSQSPHVVEAMAAALCGQHLSIDEVNLKDSFHLV